MDSFEFNKIAGGVLGTLLFVMALSVVSGGLFTPAKPAIPGYDLPSAAPEGADAAKAEPEKPLPVLLASADATSGQKKAAICSTCHSFGKDEKSKPTGPNLWGVVGRMHAADKDFEYSTANRDLGAKGDKWTYEEIFSFIKGPKAYMPGTKMTFLGMPKAEDRAAVLAYLRTLSDDPVPLPAVVADAQPAGDATKGDTAKGDGGKPAGDKPAEAQPSK
jgi:cytochrome c